MLKIGLIFFITLLLLCTVTYSLDSMNISLCSGARLRFAPANNTAKNVGTTTQTTARCTLNVTNNGTTNITVQLKLNSTNLVNNKSLMESFDRMTKWYHQIRRDTDYTNKTLLNTSMVCFDFQPFILNSTTRETVGRLKYDFNNIKQKQYYNGSTYNKINITFNNCNKTIQYALTNMSNKTGKANYFNFSNATMLEVLYKPSANSANNLTISVVDTGDVERNSSIYNLASNTVWKVANVSLAGTSGLIKEIRFYVRKSNLNTSIVYFENITANSTTYTVASMAVQYKVWTSNNVSAALNITNSLVWNNITNLTANQSKGLWVWADYYNPSRAINFSLDYQSVSNT